MLEAPLSVSGPENSECTSWGPQAPHFIVSQSKKEAPNGGPPHQKIEEGVGGVYPITKGCYSERSEHGCKTAHWKGWSLHTQEMS